MFFKPYKSKHSVASFAMPRPRGLVLAAFVLVCGPNFSVLAVEERVVFFENYCFDCHDDSIKKGGLDLLSLSTDMSDEEILRKWIHIHDRAANGEMPPKKEERPDPKELADFIAGLGEEILTAEKKAEQTDGKGLMRRMNRSEYEHALRDLLDLPLLQVKSLLPEDGVKYGFDKVPSALSLSHVQLRQYLSAAEVALNQATVKDLNAPVSVVWRKSFAEMDTGRSAISTHNAAPLLEGRFAPGLTTLVQGNPSKDAGNSFRAAKFTGKADGIAVFTGALGAHQPQGIQSDGFKVAAPGFYDVRFSIWGMRWERGEVKPAKREEIRIYRTLEGPVVEDPVERWKFKRREKPEIRTNEQNVEFYGDAPEVHVVRATLNGELLGYFDAHSLKPTEYHFKVWMKPGDKISFHAMSLPSVGPPNWGEAEGVLSYDGPAIAYDWIQIEGPVTESWPPESHRRLFGEGKPAEKDVRELLRAFADRAFRRDVQLAEIEPYAAIVEDLIKTGESIESALLAGHSAILCSPDFIFIGLEGSTTLASKLSFFLWNSLPDEELRSLAKSGKLKDSRILTAQVDRMLADPRSDRFINHFLGEWLKLKGIDFNSPDPQLYPEFDSWLRDSMLAESHAYFRKLISENLGVDHVVDSEFVMINQRLAELYGIKGVTGSEIRPVKLDEKSPRGGFLTQAGILKVTANGTETSPILRGVWVVERILGVHINPPPPNTPAVEADASGARTIRDIVEIHRQSAACASCHDIMDPPGLALESFDVIGTFRENYRLGGKPGTITLADGKKKPEEQISILTSRGDRKQIRIGGEVDASGTLPDGRAFEDLEGLKAIMIADKEILARNLARQLTIYATGKGYRFSDRAVINGVVEKTKDSGYGIRSLIHGVATSPLFLQTESFKP